MGLPKNITIHVQSRVKGGQGQAGVASRRGGSHGGNLGGKEITLGAT